MSFKKYLEWMPNRFQQARESGLIDEIPIGEKVNEWALKLKNNSNLIVKNKFQVDESDYTQEFRLILYGSDFNSCKGYDLIHDYLVFDLAQKGYQIAENEAEIWRYDNEDVAMKFVCMYAKLNLGIVGYSQSYQKISGLEQIIRTYHKQALQKTGLKLVNKRLYYGSRN